MGKITKLIVLYISMPQRVTRTLFIFFKVKASWGLNESTHMHMAMSSHTQAHTGRHMCIRAHTSTQADTHRHTGAQADMYTQNTKADGHRNDRIPNSVGKNIVNVQK